jgi:homopolymeric O-antigen transport system permease protein
MNQSPVSPAYSRELAWTLIQMDFKTRYHGTIGGFLWALLKPLTMFLVLMSVFSFVFGVEPMYRYRLIIGLFLFDFFANATTLGLMSIDSHGYLLAKAKIPTWIVVVTSVANPLLTLVILFGIVIAFELAGGIVLGSLAMMLFLMYLGSYLVIVLGFSLATSVLFVRFRDLNQIWEVVLQAGFFLAPIFYPLNIIPERYHFYLYLWPPTLIIQFVRQVLVDGVVPTPTAHAYLLLETVVILFTGVAIFRRYAPRIAERL